MNFKEKIKLFFKPIESYEYLLNNTTQCKYKDKEGCCQFKFTNCKKRFYTRCYLYIDKDLEERHSKKITTIPISLFENDPIRKQNQTLLKYLRGLK